MDSGSRRGLVIQVLSSLPPIGVMVESITPKSVVQSLPFSVQSLSHEDIFMRKTTKKTEELPRSLRLLADHVVCPRHTPPKRYGCVGQNVHDAETTMAIEIETIYNSRELCVNKKNVSFEAGRPGKL